MSILEVSGIIAEFLQTWLRECLEEPGPPNLGHRALLIGLKFQDQGSKLVAVIVIVLIPKIIVLVLVLLTIIIRMLVESPVDKNR